MKGILGIEEPEPIPKQVTPTYILPPPEVKHPRIPLDIQRAIQTGVMPPDALKPSPEYVSKVWTIRIYESDKFFWDYTEGSLRTIKHPRAVHYGVRDLVERLVVHCSRGVDIECLWCIGLHSQVGPLTSVVQEFKITTYPVLEGDALASYRTFCDHFDEGLRKGELMDPQLEGPFLEFLKCSPKNVPLVIAWDRFLKVIGTRPDFDESSVVMVPSFEEFLSGCASSGGGLRELDGILSSVRNDVKVEGKPGVWRNINWRPLPSTIRDKPCIGRP